ncbi:MAG: sodium:solute symporter family protein [Nanoarchaeota archaeon]
MIDAILIAGYMGLLIIIGVRSWAKGEMFLLADRNLNAFSTMTTINASKTGAILMILVALSFLYGVSAIWFFIGSAVGILLFLPFALHLKHEGAHYYTVADYFLAHCGKSAARITSVMTIIIMTLFLLSNIIAGMKVLSFFWQWPYWLSGLVLTSIVAFYLSTGGFRAVVRTDTIQYIALIGILALFAIMFRSGAQPMDWDLFTLPLPMLISFFILGIIFPFAMPEMWQRVYAAKGKRQIIGGFLSAALIFILSAVLLILIGLSIKSRFPSVDPDIALLYGFANMLPPGLLGLGILMLFSALMSSMDTYLFTASSALVQDWLPKKTTVRNMRITFWILGILTTGIAILFPDLLISTFIMAAISTVLAAAVIMAWKGISGVNYALIGGLLAVSSATLLMYFRTGDISPLIILYALSGVIMGMAVFWLRHSAQNRAPR